MPKQSLPRLKRSGAALAGSKINVTIGVLADAELRRDKPFHHQLTEALADAASSSAIGPDHGRCWDGQRSGKPAGSLTGY